METDKLNKRENDPGLQPQRTILSWFRSIAVIFLNALLLIKVGLNTHSHLLVALGIIALLLATFMYAYSIRRNQYVTYDIEVVSNQSITILRVISFSLFVVALLLSAHFILQLLTFL